MPLIQQILVESLLHATEELASSALPSARCLQLVMESSRLIRGQTSGCLRRWAESGEAAGTAESFAPETQPALGLCIQPRRSTKASCVPYSGHERRPQ